MEPILKWAGGKKQLKNELRLIITPELLGSNRYYEPFIGGGFLAFSLEHNKTSINDYNGELINVYNVVRDFPEELIEELKAHQKNHSKEYYYKIRALDRDFKKYSRLSAVKKAARTIYLNKTCYNGLYRVNSNGFYNVPIGRSSRMPDIVIPNKIHALSDYLNKKEIKITCGDFEEAVKSAQKNDVIYFDPPYDYENDGFKAYVNIGFNHSDLIRLRDLCDRLVKKGCKVIISNNDTKFVRECFNKDYYKIKEVETKRYINCKGKNRTKAREVIIYGEK